MGTGLGLPAELPAHPVRLDVPALALEVKGAFSTEFAGARVQTKEVNFGSKGLQKPCGAHGGNVASPYRTVLGEANFV